MLPYWLLWTYFFLGAMLSNQDVLEPGRRTRTLGPFLLVGLLFAILMIGLRFDVGADWRAYQRIFRWSGQAELTTVLGVSDPGYYLLNWIVQQSGFGIWAVNCLCGLVIMTGIAALARTQPLPWLTILISIPYFVIVVAMGYSRQAVALGFMMIGLAGLIRNGSILRYALWIALGATFHKTVVIALPFAAFVSRRGAFIDILLVASASLGLYSLFLEDAIQGFVKDYVGTRYSSSGALLRVAMCVVPATAFLLFRRSLDFEPAEEKLWRNFALLSLVAAVALALSPSSTAVDRAALYLLPIQLAVLSRIPGNLLPLREGKLLISAYTAAVLMVWVTFAAHAEYWIPYQSWLTQG